MTTNTIPAVHAMIQGRRADSTRRRQRVLSALDTAVKDGAELSVTGIAPAESTAPSSTVTATCSNASTPPKPCHPTNPRSAPRATLASLQVDLLAAEQRCTRMAARTQQLETRLSELLGEHAWRATGLGVPPDIDQLQQRIVTLEQQIVELRLQLEERDEDLAAARAANHELMARLNTPTRLR